MGKYTIKDLRVACSALCDVVLVDNCVLSFSKDLANGIWIRSFYGDQNDSELLYLSRLLMKVKDRTDVRDFLRGELQYEKLLSFF